LAEEPHARTTWNACGYSAAPTIAQAHAQLDLGVLEREVRANLVYRQFTRVEAEKVPDAKTLGRLALALGPQIIEQIHARLIAIACERRFVHGRGCAWMPRSWRLTFSTRPTAPCWAMALGY